MGEGSFGIVHEGYIGKGEEWNERWYLDMQDDHTVHLMALHTAHALFIVEIMPSCFGIDVQLYIRFPCLIPFEAKISTCLTPPNILCHF
jgi:hypothetical protein